MKKVIGLFLLCIVAIGSVLFAQADLDSFPIGRTEMVYNIFTEEMDEPQLMKLLVVAREDGPFTVRMSTEATGTKEQLSGFGFLFGATSIASGGGYDISYPSLQALIEQRSRLQEGKEYILPSGGIFTDISRVTIAGVQCLEGSFVNPDNENMRMTTALALSHPVYISPRIRIEERHDGDWAETFVMELVEYTVIEGED